MPIYEYHCNACGTDFEAWQKITATGASCEACSSEDTTRKISATSFVLKGSGWYKTDYGGKSAGAATKGEDKGTGGSSDGDRPAQNAEKPADKPAEKADKPAGKPEPKAAPASSD